MNGQQDGRSSLALVVRAADALGEDLVMDLECRIDGIESRGLVSVAYSGSIRIRI
jgi:hypothetical protein